MNGAKGIIWSPIGFMDVVTWKSYEMKSLETPDRGFVTTGGLSHLNRSKPYDYKFTYHFVRVVLSATKTIYHNKLSAGFAFNRLPQPVT